MARTSQTLVAVLLVGGLSPGILLAGFGRYMNPPPPWGRAAFGLARPFMQAGHVNSPLGNVHPFNSRHNTFDAGSTTYMNRTHPNSRGARNPGMGGGQHGAAHYSGAGARQTTGGPGISGYTQAEREGPVAGNESPEQAENDTRDGLNEAGLKGLDQPLHWPGFWNAWYHGSWPVPSSAAATEWLDHWQTHPWGPWAAMVARDGPANWVTGWTFYAAGLGKYENPYLTGHSSPVDYSRPVDTAHFLMTEREPHSLAYGPLSEALDLMHTGNYAQALTEIESVLQKDPGNVALHELRALALFGLRRFDDAAETLYAVLSVSPGCNWTTLIGEFGSMESYNASLGILRAQLKTPQHASADHFVIAYHYMCQGHSDAARVHYLRALEGESRDQVSRLMVDLLPDPKQNAASADKTAENPAPVANPTTPQPDKDENDGMTEKERREALAAEVARAAEPYLGVWKSSGADGQPISLEFLDNGTFRWKRGGTAAAFESEGRFEINSDMLGIQFENGALLLARVGKSETGQVVMEPIRAPPGTAELTFSRE